ncbi:MULTISPECIES: hypothetical protein [Rhizobium/Agrobacterium group]|uniref:Uncharacterized protein n=1 Tax=Allorhizobium ampelinum (strain ATCC BAA-846 / DSM 112012 / S4) TaxID=311402 RepID=B9K2S4_ALLAM|nr:MULTISPECIES: hypothetical protein [Rhizobium/Agrobacterium group]ACM39172.1 hypothetical protein Avi_6187 [Allorhizobium ampelinum S4]MUO27196.1 hypothetical protein [Agrobacterium vitis]
MKDLHSSISRVVAIGNATLTADNTPTAIDLRGYDSAEICLDIGVGGITFSGTNKIEFVLTHSDDNTTYTNVADADMLGVSGISNGIIKALTAAHAAAAVYRYGYKGGKRYLKLLADFGGTHGTGTPIAASVILGNGFNNPQANQA